MLKTHRLAFASVALLFFLFGFITCLNDILIPHLKLLFELNYRQSMLIQFAFFSAYFFFSIPAGWILRKLGYANGIVVGLVIAAVGALCFLPAGYSHSYALFLSAIFILACGVTLLQVGANPYITALGTAQSAPARLNFAQALNSLGTTLAPLIGSYLILSSHSAQDTAQKSSTALPYLGIGCLLLFMGFLFKQVPLPAINDDVLEKELNETPDARDQKRQDRNLMWGIFGIFCYVGAEVGIGSFLTNYIMLSWSVPPENAGRFVAVYWFLAMMGRFVGVYFLTRFKAADCLKVATLMAGTLVVLGMLTRSAWSPYFFLAVGAFNSIMFPVIFSLSVEGLGRRTSKASSYLCMAIVGGAILPFLQGWLSDSFGVRWAFCLPLGAYLYLAWFAVHMGRRSLVLEGESNGSFKRKNMSSL